MKRCLAAMALLCGALLASCQDALIEPFENDERFFTIFGYLDLSKTEHTLRVVPVMKVPERIEDAADPQAVLDVEVTTTDLDLGQTVRWQRRLERLADGTYAHLFRGNFTPTQGHTYRLEVRRTFDDVTATAETTMPDIRHLTDAEADFGPIEIRNDSLFREVVLPEIERPWIVMVYIVNSIPFRIVYGREGATPMASGGWRFTWRLTADAGRVHEAVAKRLPDGGPYFLDRMFLHVHELDEQWDPPGAVFDPEVLAQPGVLSNVENGYGFFGSFATFRQELLVDVSLSEALGFDYRIR